MSSNDGQPSASKNLHKPHEDAKNSSQKMPSTVFSGRQRLPVVAAHLSGCNLRFSSHISGNLQLFPTVKGTSAAPTACHLQPEILDFLTCCNSGKFYFTFLGCSCCWSFPHGPASYMAKGKKSKNQAAITSSTGKVATAAAATAAANVKDNNKGSSFQAFISDLEASPPLNPLSHASAGYGPNTMGRQEEEQPVGNGGKTETIVSAKLSFAGLFSTNRKLTMENKLSKFHIEEGTITLESDDLTNVRAKLGFCIVSYIAGKFPGMQAIRALSKTWGASFQQHDSGWLVFRFARDDDRQRILAEGPYFIYGRPLLLKPMPDCFEFKEDDISLTPVWATLPSLPLECWHPNALGKIGSRLGTPIAMDSLTMRMERVSYARILVEFDASKALVDHVEFKLPNGVSRRQPVVYEYTPKFCTECNRFGHQKAHAVITNNQLLPLPLPLLVNLLPINSLLRRRYCRPNGLWCNDDKKQSTNSHKLQSQNCNRNRACRSQNRGRLLQTPTWPTVPRNGLATNKLERAKTDQLFPAKGSSRSVLLGLLLRAGLHGVNATPYAGDYGLHEPEIAA
ncbi:UNVERIFIED_CONTAM: hypothetical protein Scaly_2988100 [Sesamum calycinum]|uniref:DUF4283 domain-containing protein n=1 Tax=Sesamum calycinum TaxID=2727403 RepID=A0AAW2KEI5_9LAMI